MLFQFGTFIFETTLQNENTETRHVLNFELFNLEVWALNFRTVFAFWGFHFWNEFTKPKTNNSNIRILFLNHLSPRRFGAYVYIYIYHACWMVSSSKPDLIIYAALAAIWFTPIYIYIYIYITRFFDSSSVPSYSAPLLSSLASSFVLLSARQFPRTLCLYRLCENASGAKQTGTSRLCFHDSTDLSAFFNMDSITE